MQEDKESLFDAADTLLACLGVMAPMVESMKFQPQAMAQAAEGWVHDGDGSGGCHGASRHSLQGGARGGGARRENRKSTREWRSRS